MNTTLNPYRGCEHGCIYCYARPTHEFFGLSAGLDFETKIFVKQDTAELLKAKLGSPKWQPIETLAQAGIPVNAMIGPVLPGLTEHEIPSILESAAQAGAYSAYYNVLRLPHGVKDLFQTWLREHYPDRADKILNRIRSMRDGKLNDPNFGARMHGKGIYADQIEQIFNLYRTRYNLTRRSRLSVAAFNRDAMSPQLRLLL